ncbi:Fic family protein [Planococcus sp. YIM B11945]|uniref:Fic family protein n=1 Tax=Planococcus sp. YIM B11945 TaxID=3435410 RepID=UPI003D7CAF41
MKPLNKIFHQLSNADFNKEYAKRKSFDSTKVFDLTIKPIDQSETFSLYYVPTAEMISTIEQIYEYDKELENIFENLPDVAKEQFIIESVAEELYNTNDLEGIRSSKAELVESTRDAFSHKKTNKRFTSMIKSYAKLVNKDIEAPATPGDIRNIYDYIASEEVAVKEQLDGKLFRKEVTHILKKSGTGKIIHRGLIDEDNIITHLEKLLAFMDKGNHQVPKLIKVAIGHYYFGYIHPFYDGNGRTSRFISSVYLSEFLFYLTAISLSRASNNYINDYLDAFEITNSIKSRGELNFFIETFLGLIIKGQIDVLSEIKEKQALLEAAIRKIQTEDYFKDKDDHYKSMVFILAQNHFFSNEKGMTAKELSEILAFSDSTARKILNELTDAAILQKNGLRPVYYSPAISYFEN